MLTKENLFNEFYRVGLKHSDVILIHSSLKSINLGYDAKIFISYLKEYFSDGLIIFPTHTWATIRDDGAIFDTNKTPSCVGALTNIALQCGFKRSHHPTHSVCAYGKNADAYLSLDDKATTPVGPDNCFGVLKDMNAKMLFIGCPLSKITFVHSIEEEYDIPDRFTDHIYHFITIDNDNKYDYNMPRHYSKYSEHLSNHYEKLNARMIEMGISLPLTIGDATSYLVDAKSCHKYVVELLKKDRHVFDDYREI